MNAGVLRGRLNAGTANRPSRESGQAIILMSLSLVAVLGMVGLVVDLGWAEWRKLACKTASQAATMAAIKVARNATDFTCGSGLTCQSDTACPGTLSDPTNALQVGCMYAQQNGFTNGGRQSVLLAANITSPPVTGTSPTYWVSATVSETIPTGFTAVLGRPTVTVAARSTAAFYTNPNGGCIFVLNPSASGALSGSGTPSISNGCGVYVDSNSASAISLNGNASITTTGGAKTYIVGNCSGCGNISPAPIVGAPLVSDPFAAMPVPAAASGSCSAAVSLAGGSTQTITAGKYCGSPAIQLKGHSHLTLGTGTYVLQGGLDMGGSTTMTATGGVMLYVPSGSISYAGGATVTLTPQTAGTYKGVLFWQDKADTNSVSLVGGAGQLFNGALYFPKATLSFTGGTNISHTNTTIVVDKLSLVGNSYIQSAADTNYQGGAIVTAYIE
jgi:hypothetical protein